MKLLEDRYGYSQEAASQLDGEEKEELTAALLELRGQLRKLQWYGEVNRRGFVKITKKLDKNIPTALSQKKYLPLKVDPSPFATNTELLGSVTKVNEWLSLLNDVSLASGDDRASISSSSSRRTATRPILNIAPEIVTHLDHLIREDREDDCLSTLAKFKSSATDLNEGAYQHFLKFLLQRSITQRRRHCVSGLLKQIVFLDDPDDINRRNCIHRLVISIGRSQTNNDYEASGDLLPDAEAELYSFITPAASPKCPPRRTVAQEAAQKQTLGRNDEDILFLQYFLDHLTSSQRPALLARDGQGRTPLHYAAEHGVKVLCEIIIEHLQLWGLFNVHDGIDGSGWLDDEGWAPLHLSVIGGHPRTTQYLLDAEGWGRERSTKSNIHRSSPKSLAALALATKANFVDIVRILVQAGFDINSQDENGETALHVAARFGHTDCARLLIEGSPSQRANTELAEKTYGWTPLFTASVDGHLPIVDLLVDAEADLERLDSSGWTAKEHASLRGHLDITSRLAEVMPELEVEPDASAITSTSPPAAASLLNRKSNGPGSNTSLTKTTEAIKSFGHRYLTDKSMVLVSLGTMDMRKNVSTVSLDRIPLTNAHSTQLDMALSIVVSAQHAEGEAEVFDLPIQDNLSTEPVVFYATDPSKVKVLFDLVPTYAGSQKQIVGRAVALLSTIKPHIGSKRISLQADLTVPIIAANTLEVIGSVTFNFLVITPFHHPNMSVKEDQTYWKSVTSTMVIGHRGLGKNMLGRRSLQLGENTIQSFIAAANLGASYVEFDVQLTKDHVPVLYHDFLVSETGIDAPVHTLTLEQFLHVSDNRTPRTSRSGSPLRNEKTKVRNAEGGEGTRLRRSMSVGGAYVDSTELDEKMKHTRDFKKKGFKGNTRGHAIQAPFATLEEMFKKLPPSVGFNIELKYPMLFESEDEEMDTYAVEVNSFVDTVLKTVYEHGKGRNMLFSSFNPDICLLTAFKQPSIPVLFLTDAGTSPAGDIRASSLQEAIRFASRWNLLGIVSAAEPLVLSPRLVRVVKESGLVCVSYGVLNNDPSKVKLQVKQGIDAVIVDSVLAIRKGLTEGEVQVQMQTPVQKGVLGSPLGLKAEPLNTPQQNGAAVGGNAPGAVPVVKELE